MDQKEISETLQRLEEYYNWKGRIVWGKAASSATGECFVAGFGDKPEKTVFVRFLENGQKKELQVVSFMDGEMAKLDTYDRPFAFIQH